MEVEDIAHVCHEANRAYSLTIGDKSHSAWVDSPDSIKQSAIKGVLLVQSNPDKPPSFNHANWLREKLREGWSYASFTDIDAKKHPCILDYEQLPTEQKVKDILFKNIVIALTQGDTNV